MSDTHQHHAHANKASPDASEAPESAAGTIWTCPMHSQIRWDHPGNCPICGMALEPIEPSLDEGPSSELMDMNRRFRVSAVLTIPLVVLSMTPELFGWSPLPKLTSAMIQFGLATPVVLRGGWPFFQRFWRSLRNNSPNMFTLIGLGVGVAYGYSV